MSDPQRAAVEGRPADTGAPQPAWAAIKDAIRGTHHDYTEGPIGLEAAYQWTVSDEQHTTGAAELRVFWRLNDHHRGWLGYSHGDENNPPLPIAEVHTGFAAWDWTLTRTLTLRLHGSYEHREDFYERIGGGVNAVMRF